MPFWSKKGKERAANQDENEPRPGFSWVLDEATGELVQQHGYRLPPEVLKQHEEKWWDERQRREQIVDDFDEDESFDEDDSEPWSPCSTISLTAEEAFLEADLMWTKADSVHWTKDEIRQYNPKSFDTTAFVTKRLEEDFAKAHADCCKRKAGIDQRLAWAIRNLTTYNGKQLLEDMKINQKAAIGSSPALEAEEAAPPAYTEASAPAYSDTTDRPAEKEAKVDVD